MLRIWWGTVRSPQFFFSNIKSSEPLSFFLFPFERHEKCLSRWTWCLRILLWYFFWFSQSHQHYSASWAIPHQISQRISAALERSVRRLRGLSLTYSGYSGSVRWRWSHLAVVRKGRSCFRTSLSSSPKNRFSFACLNWEKRSILSSDEIRYAETLESFRAFSAQRVSESRTRDFEQWDD